MPQGKTAELHGSCQPSMKNETWHRLTIVNLVEEGWCPPTSPRPHPSAASASLNLPSVERTNAGTKKGSKFALEKLAVRGFLEKS